jgi:hypothetical protein
MTTYVLVGGAWLGGWCWQRVTRRLCDEGHDAYPVILTSQVQAVTFAATGIASPTSVCAIIKVA